MKLLPIILLTLCLYMPSMLAMNQSMFAADAPTEGRAFLCEAGKYLTIAAASVSILQAYEIHREYREHGCSSRLAISVLAGVGYMTGTLAYLATTIHSCNQ